MQAHVILKIPRDATAIEARQAYRRLAFRHHPDRGGDPRRFAQVSKAYRQFVSQSQQPHEDCAISPNRRLAPKPPAGAFRQAQTYGDSSAERHVAASSGDSMATRLLGKIISLLDRDVAAVIALTIICAFAVTVQVERLLAPMSLSVMFACMLCLLATPALLAVLASGRSFAQGSGIFVKVVLVITAGAAAVQPGTLFGFP